MTGPISHTGKSEEFGRRLTHGAAQIDAPSSASVVVRWAGYGLLVLFFFLYLYTLDTGFVPGELEGGDLITHQYAQVQARPSNAPGYPVYTIGGWLWFHGLRTLWRWLGNPLPNPIPILSSYSMLWALAGLWLFFRIICHLTRRPDRPAGNWPVAWLLSTFYGATYFFWYYATTTEQYSSAIAQTLAIVYVYLLWRDEAGLGGRGKSGTAGGRQAGAPERALGDDNTTSRQTHYLLLLAFLCGLSLAHMATVAMVVPPLVVVILWERPDLMRRPKIVGSAILAAFAPLLSYAYVYVRGTAHPEWWGSGQWRSPEAWFWDFVSAPQGRDELSWGLESGRPFLTQEWPALVWQELSLPLLLVGLVGLYGLGRRTAWLLYGTLALYAVLCWVDRFGNWYQVILPTYPLILLGVAVMVDHLPRWVTGSARTAIQPVVMLFLIVAIVWRFDASWPVVNSRMRAEDTALVQPARLLDQPLPRSAALFAEKSDALGLAYLVDIWGIRPDLKVVSSPEAAIYLAQGRTLLSTWQATPLLQSELPAERTLYLNGAGPDWVSLSVDEGVELPQPQVFLGKHLGDGIELVGYSVSAHAGESPVLRSSQRDLIVTLYWRVMAGQTPQDWSVSVRLLAGETFLATPDGERIQQDNPGPVHGLLPFSQIPHGRTVADSYRLSPAPNMDGVMVILYRVTEDGFSDLAQLGLPFPGPG